MAGIIPGSRGVPPPGLRPSGGEATLLLVQRNGATCEMDVNVNPLRTDLCGDVLAIDHGGVALPDTPGLVAAPVPSRIRQYGQEGG